MITTLEYRKSVDTLQGVFGHKNAQKVFNKDPEKLKFTVGNSKIGEDTLIFNMGSAHACPSAKLGLCDMAHKKYGGDGTCYALQAEYFYPQSLPFRTMQKVQWETLTAAQIADEMFTEIIRSQKTKYPIKFVRYNESGDFYSIDCVRKAGRIAGYIAELCEVANIPTVKFYTYTHRSDIFQGDMGKTLVESLPKNFTVNGSNFKVHNEFRVMNVSRAERDARDANGKKVNKFTCLDDCSKCSLCKIHGEKGITIIQAVH
jgi:hypothetical protein